MAKRFKHYDITIGGRTFEVCGETETNRTCYGNDRDEIYRVYGRPSDSKVSIWHDWVDWANRDDVMANLQIAGTSCMFFSISGNVIVNGEKYLLYITYANNRAYKVVGL